MTEELYIRLAKEYRDRESKEAFAKFGHGKWHAGPCCHSCQEDPLENWCCCNDGKYELENKDHEPLYPPADGSPPPEFRHFGDRTKERWYRRFKDNLGPHTQIQTYSNEVVTARELVNTQTGERYRWNR